MLAKWLLLKIKPWTENLLRCFPEVPKGDLDARLGRCPNCGCTRIKVRNQWPVEYPPTKLYHFYAVCRSCHTPIWRHGDPDDPRLPIWDALPTCCNCAHDRND